MIASRRVRTGAGWLLFLVLVFMPFPGFCGSALVIDAAAGEYRVINPAAGEMSQPLPGSKRLEFRPEGGRKGAGGLRCTALGTARPIQIGIGPGVSETAGAALSAFTIAGWIKPETLGNVTLMERLPQEAGCVVFGVRMSGSVGPESAEGRGVLSLGITEVGEVLSSMPLYLESGKWAHLAVTFDSGTVVFYVNGEMFGGSRVFEKREVPGMASERPFVAVGRGLQGELGDVVWLFGKALGAEEIRSLYGNDGKTDAATFLKE